MNGQILPDGDYLLSEGRAWLTVGEASIRVLRRDDNSVCVSIYRFDGEDNDALASCCVSEDQLLKAPKDEPDPDSEADNWDQDQADAVRGSADPVDLVIALTMEQSEMVRSLIYSAIKTEPDEKQRDFLNVLVDQFEQSED